MNRENPSTKPCEANNVYDISKAIDKAGQSQKDHEKQKARRRLLLAAKKIKW